MASLAKTYDNQKLNGKVYTPEFIVNKILDDIQYNSSDILGKTILDPACGDGRFLTIAAQRILQYSKPENLNENLEKIYGWDIDEQAVEECRQNLNELIKDRNLSVNWNIEVCNSIEKLQKSNLFQTDKCQKFDFIVGNPPYIRIQHLDELQRKYIQQNYTFCNNGSTDIYIAFFELCYDLLNKNGICSLITPNTYFYTETAKKLRDQFSANKCLRQITNYAELQLFENATTYSAITIFDKQKHETINYQHAADKSNFKEKQIDIKELTNQKFWQLSTESMQSKAGKKLKDICKIHVGITTLCDKAYIFPTEPIDEKYVFANTRLKGKIKIESGILKPIVKGSTLKNGDEKIKEYIIFPYKKISGKNQIIPENILQKEFPLCYEYLLSVKDELIKRDNGNPVNPWYAFGRSQGLDTSFGKKIIFSPMNKKPNFIIHENEESTLYSGYCIKYQGDLKTLSEKLNSDKMQKFVEMSSRDFRGGWKAYNKKVVEEFVID
jgi:methylase of polypeptide subunit release factors